MTKGTDSATWVKRNRTASAPSPVFVNDLIRDFMNNFGDKFQIDLSYNETPKQMPITLSADDFERFQFDDHPYIRFDDGEIENEDKHVIGVHTTRLRDVLWLYAGQKLVTLTDRKRIALKMDESQLNEIKDSVSKVVDDSINMGQIKLKENENTPTPDQISCKLEEAWMDTVKLHKPAKSVPNR